MSDRIVREREARELSGLSRSRRHELAKLGLFPQKVKLSERASGYKLSELMHWLDSRPRSNALA